MTTEPDPIRQLRERLIAEGRLTATESKPVSPKTYRYWKFLKSLIDKGDVSDTLAVPLTDDEIDYLARYVLP